MPARMVLVSTAVAMVAAMMGCVALAKPELFLRIPEVGFIPWALTGGRMPPFFDATSFDPTNFHRWAQDGDVIVASAIKSGTMMLHQMVYLLRSGGHYDFERLTDEIGNMQLMKYPEHLLEKRITEQNARRARVGLGNQQWLTHMAPGGKKNLYGLDPKKHPGIKYLCITRNGKEVVRSYFPFLNAYSKEGRDVWGGFPPPVKLPEDVLNLVLHHAEFYFEHGEQWWDVRNAPNVLLLHFTDVLSDKKGTIEKIAEFLGIELTEELAAVVLEKSSHEFMQQNSKKYVQYIGYPGKEIVRVKEGKHIRKGGGKSDGAKDFFTPDMDAKWDAAVNKYWGHKPELIEWALKSGEVK